MDIFKEFIEKNKNKVLGKIVTKRGAYGDEQIVEGSISNLERINVNDLQLVNNSISSFTKLTVEAENEKLKKIVEKGKIEIKNKPKQKRKKRKKKIEDIIFFDAQKDIDLYSFEEGFQNLNSHLTQEQVDVWVWYKMSNGLPISDKWKKVSNLPNSSDAETKFILENLKNNNICYDFNKKGMAFIPSVLYYSGNLYERLESIDKARISQFEIPNRNYNTKEILKRQKDHLEHIFENDKQLKPLQITLDESKSLRLNVHSQFLRDYSFVSEGVETNLKSAFIEFLSGLSLDEMRYYTGGTDNVITYFIEKKSYNEKTVGMAQSDFKRLVSQEMTFQVNRFLNTLPDQIKKEIEYKWNKSYNGFKIPNYDLIPIAFEYNKLFKNRALKPRNAQREGVAFIEAKGNGVVAFDVGVGKTMTSILALGQALDNDECKRPLIIVPKPTLKKWISEINGEYEDGEVVSHGILPQYPLINLGNLGKKYKDQFFDAETGFNLDIPEKCICIATFPAVDHIGFNEETANEHFSQLKEMLVTIPESATGKRDKRNRANQIESLNSKIGIGQSKAYVLADEMGFDYLCVDEAHNFTKVFSSVRSNDGKGATDYEIYQKDSARSVKMFFITNYIQRMNDYRNIVLLTATPFNNNPLEVFGLLALTDYKGLKDSGVNNIQTFFDNFIDQTFESVVKADLTIDSKAVIKGWSNKVALQKLVFAYMNYKSGEGNVERPNKHELPLLNEKLNDGTVIPLPIEKQKRTFLDVTNRQRENIKAISKWLVYALNDEQLRKGAHLKASSLSMSNTLSPDIYEISEQTSGMEEDEKKEFIKNYISELDPIDFVEESPKLKYTMECIKSIQEHHKKTNTKLSNIILYSGRGVSFFQLIKRYLIEEMGYKAEVETPYGKFSEVEIIAGSGVPLGLSDARKEAGKEAFNKGYIKVIIGSQTIREGIDLQKKTSTLFNLWCEWNPTSYKQLVGRCYRYGNMFNDVRIVTPLAIGGSDSFVWQKLEEKTGRINDIFDLQNDENILDVGVEDTEAIKWSLIDDVESLAKLLIKEERIQIKSKIDIEEKRQIEIVNVIANQNRIEQYEREINEFSNTYKGFVSDKYIKDYGKDENFVDLENPFAVVKKIYANRVQIHRVLVDINDWRRNTFMNKIFSANNKVREFKLTSKKVEKANNYILKAFGEVYLSKPEMLSEKLAENIEAIRSELKEVNSPEYFLKEVQKIEESREKAGNQMLTFDETVEVFKSTNYLLDNFEEEKPVETKPDPKPKAKKVVKPKINEKDNELELLKIDLEAVKLAIELEDEESMLKALNGDLEAVELAIELL